MSSNSENLKQFAEAVERKHQQDEAGAFKLSPPPQRTSKRNPAVARPRTPRESKKRPKDGSPAVAIAKKPIESGYVCLWFGCTFEGAFATPEELDWHQKTFHVGMPDGVTFEASGLCNDATPDGSLG